MFIVTDYDDTYFRTYPVMYNNCVKEGVKVHYGTYLRPDNTKGVLQKYLDSAEFMIGLESYENAYNTLLHFKNAGHTILACTHRGYHPRSQEFTDQCFDRHGESGLIEHTYYIDGRVDHDKVEYLDKELGAGNYILIDDRPSGPIRPESPSVVLFTQPWNAHWEGVRIDDWGFPHVVSALASAQAKIRGQEDDGIFRV